jgi:hypothetical protein
MVSSTNSWRTWSPEKIVGTQFEVFVYDLFTAQSKNVDWNVDFHHQGKTARVDLVEKRTLLDIVTDTLLPFTPKRGNIYSNIENEEIHGNKNFYLYELKYSSRNNIDISERGNPVKQLLGYCKITGFKPGGIITNSGFSRKMKKEADKKEVKLYDGNYLLKIDSERRSLDGFGIIDPLKWFLNEKRMYNILDKKIRSTNLDKYDLKKIKVYLK